MAFPTPIPSRGQSQDVFDPAVAAFMAYLPTFETAMNALGAAMSTSATNDTSTSSVLIGSGNKTFTVTAGKSFWPGMYLSIADASAPTTNSMGVQVVSYSGTTLVVTVVFTVGSGTIANWTISQAAAAPTVDSLQGFQTTATAAGTTTLTSVSPWKQFFTGTTTQTVVMPLLSTIADGWSRRLDNDSTGIVTVNAHATDGGATLVALAQGDAVLLTRASGAWDIFIAAKRNGDSAQNFTGATITAATQLIGKGTATNDSASAGQIGELVTSSASGVSMTTATPINITSISLTAGDWDVFGNAQFGGTATALSYCFGSISTTTGTLGAANTRGGAGYSAAGQNVFAITDVYAALPTIPLQLAATTTIYLVSQAGFGGGTCNGSGTITARRRR